MELSSLSASISKESVTEGMTMFHASLEDAKAHPEETISNERIMAGDEILGTYQVKSEPLSGGMGSVWQVYHRSWNMDLAMKRPHPRFFAEAGEERKMRFMEECENWINLGMHPNIVYCFYVREIGGVPSIFSEWMDGGSLKDAIRSGKLYQGSEEEIQRRILDIAIQICNGLNHAHYLHLVHQDIKPGNILLMGNWQVKIGDFGLAKARKELLDTEEYHSVLSSGSTLEYCPAEQIEPGANAEEWMDFYAWGLTVLEMYYGNRVWIKGAEVSAKIDDLLCDCPREIPEPIQNILRETLGENRGNIGYPLLKLEKIWQDIFGERYARRIYDSPSLTASALNNRALSFFDLGREDLAIELCRKALRLNPDHIDAENNLRLILQRTESDNLDQSLDLRLSKPVSLLETIENEDRASRLMTHALNEYDQGNYLEANEKIAQIREMPDYSGSEWVRYISGRIVNEGIKKTLHKIRPKSVWKNDLNVHYLQDEIFAFSSDEKRFVAKWKNHPDLVWFEVPSAYRVREKKPTKKPIWERIFLRGKQQNNDSEIPEDSHRLAQTEYCFEQVDPETGAIMHEIGKRRSAATISDACLAHREGIAFCACLGGYIKLLEMDTGKELYSYQETRSPSELKRIAISPNERYLAVCTGTDDLIFYELDWEVSFDEP